MKANYQAWQVDPKAFDARWPLRDQILFLLRFAVLAPSSHNSQPWRFLLNEHAITIAPEPKRFLPVSDPRNRNLYIALGCAIENILIAADYCGLSVQMNDTQAEGRFALTMNFMQATKEGTSPDHLVFSIPKRRMNRNAYHNILPDLSFLDALKSYAPDDVRLDVISDPKRKAEIAVAMIDIREQSFADQHFRTEMAAYKRNNLTRSFLGIPGATMGFGLLKSFVAPWVIKKFNVITALRKEELAMLVEHTPAIAVVSTTTDTEKDWMWTGRLFQRIALEAARRDIQVAASAAPLDPRVMQEKLGTTLYPQLFFRIGYATKAAAHAPRFLAADVTQLNAS
jgi:hypothetical protein